MSNHKKEKVLRITDSQLNNIVKESAQRILIEKTYDVPVYERPVFIDCESKRDAVYRIEIGYSSYASSLFYVGESYDEYDALEKVVDYLVDNDIIDLYVEEDTDAADEFPNDYVECNGYAFPIDKLFIEKLVKENLNRKVNRRKAINENVADSFYDEEDMNGKVGRPGMIKAFDIGHLSVENVKLDAKDNRMPFKKYLKYWWNEINADWVPFEWIVPGKGYGHEGDVILRYGNVVFRDIFGQLMVDEYPVE